MILYSYSKCSTCKKAIKFLENNNIKFELKDISMTELELNEILKYVNIDKIYNTCGKSYRELNLKEVKKTMSVEEQIKLLSSDKMLIKRPVLFLDNGVLVGFNEKNWTEVLLEGNL